jgi:hypothetical protein
MTEKTERHVERGKRAARQAGDEVEEWAEPMARIGYAAKGFVYLAAGVLTVASVVGYGGGQATGSKGALATLASQPFGQAILIALAVGLFAYTGWCFVQAILDPEHKGSDAKGLVKRGAKAISGLIYGSLGVYAVHLSQGTASSAGGGQSRAASWSAEVMQWPGGRWLVGIGGAIIAIYGLVQAWRGKELEFLESLKEREIGHKQHKAVKVVGQAGLWARAVVFLMIGGFIILAAVQHQPGEARGLRGALTTLLSQPYGQWLMAAVALGLACYGLFCFVKARYRVIDT